MFKRTQKVVAGVGALAALAAGGAVLAQARSAAPIAAEQTSAPDRDAVQSGDQTTPDRPASLTVARKGHHSRSHVHHPGGHHGPGARAAGVATGTAQTGEQTAPDQPGVSEQCGAESPEQSGTAPEPAANSDGPGGHADEPGNANADHQFQGTE